ncbi:hypothetical protein [Lysinibacillus fusiformis]
MKNDAIMYIDDDESFFMRDDGARSICSELDTAEPIELLATLHNHLK